MLELENLNKAAFLEVEPVSPSNVTFVVLQMTDVWTAFDYERHDSSHLNIIHDEYVQLTMSSHASTGLPRPRRCNMNMGSLALSSSGNFGTIR